MRLWALHRGKGEAVRLSPVERWTAAKTGRRGTINPSALEAWQMERVREVVRYARGHSPLYAEKFSDVDESALARYADLSRLPFTRPEEVARCPESLLCIPSAGVARVVTLATSGRTGDADNPKRIFFSDSDIDLSIDFFGLGMTTLIREGQRVSIMMSNESENSIADLLKKGIERYGGEAEIHGHIQDIALAAESAARADCIVGVPSEILRLCRTRPELRTESLLLSADFVPEAILEAVKRAWGSRIYTHYGMTETGYACAVQCDAGGDYHLRHADMLLEVVDPATGARLPDGEEGEVAVTTFAHRAMPLIRYRTGDIAHMNAAPCPCGGLLPRLAKVRGRFCGAISLGGLEIAIEALDEILYAIPELLGYRAEITGEAGRKILSLTIDASAPLAADDVVSRVQAALKGAIDLAVRFETLPPSIGRAKRRVRVQAYPAKTIGPKPPHDVSLSP